MIVPVAPLIVGTAAVSVSCVALYDGSLSVKATPHAVLLAQPLYAAALPPGSAFLKTGARLRAPPFAKRTVYDTVGAATEPPTAATFCTSTRASSVTVSLYWPTTDADVAATCRRGPAACRADPAASRWA